ncbi:MAG: hypothetical protein A2Z58_03825 [Planctomycetes bacterium RIFCSPHIGHO2_12_42_15]|nr:MAG: hypothetical protein A2Z58_03825 [Planctomycetes bacterium RIFCSPHIGHO2_12_42_15]
MINYIGKKEDCQFEISKEIFPNPKEHKKERGGKRGTGERSKIDDPFFSISPHSPFLLSYTHFC